MICNLMPAKLPLGDSSIALHVKDGHDLERHGAVREASGAEGFDCGQV